MAEVDHPRGIDQSVPFGGGIVTKCLLGLGRLTGILWPTRWTRREVGVLAGAAAAIVLVTFGGLAGAGVLNSSDDFVNWFLAGYLVIGILGVNGCGSIWLLFKSASGPESSRRVCRLVGVLLLGLTSVLVAILALHEMLGETWP